MSKQYLPSKFAAPAFLRTALAAAVICSPACSSLRTMDARDGGVVDTKPRVGLHYFLPRGVIQVKGTAGTDTYTIDITRSNVPDTSERFFLQQTSSLFHDDTSKFKINEAGLLTEAIDSSGDPKIDAIIAKLLETAVNMGKIKAAQASPPPGAKVGGAPPPQAYRPFNVSFDPFDSGEIARATEAVRLAGFAMDIVARPGKPEGEARVQLDARGTPRVTNPAHSSAGVLYRLPTTVKVSLHGIGMESNYPLIISRSVSVPDPARVATYSMKRGVFTKRGQKIVMVAGEPTDVDFSHPSELLGFVSLPASISATVLANLGPLSNLFYKPAPKSQLPAASQATQGTAGSQSAPGAPVTDRDSSAAGEGYRTSVPLKGSGSQGGGSGLGTPLGNLNKTRLEKTDTPPTPLPEIPGAPGPGTGVLPGTAGAN